MDKLTELYIHISKFHYKSNCLYFYILQNLKDIIFITTRQEKIDEETLNFFWLELLDIIQVILCSCFDCL